MMERMAEDLVTWLRAQLDEDEQTARAAKWADRTGRWEFDEYVEDDQARWELHFDKIAPVLDDTSGIGMSPMRHMARHDPARVLAEVDAKRRILDVYQADVIDVSRRGGPPEWMHGAVPVEAHSVLRLLALPYADRPGYRDEWKP